MKIKFGNYPSRSDRNKTRIVKKFLFLPLSITQGEWYWLETAYVVENCSYVEPAKNNQPVVFKWMPARLTDVSEYLAYYNISTKQCIIPDELPCEVCEDTTTGCITGGNGIFSGVIAPGIYKVC